MRVVGWCDFALCVCMCSLTQSCLTLCHHMDCSPLGSSVHGFSRQGSWDPAKSILPCFQSRSPPWSFVFPPREQAACLFLLPSPPHSTSTGLGVQHRPSRHFFGRWNLSVTSFPTCPGSQMRYSFIQGKRRSGQLEKAWKSSTNRRVFQLGMDGIPRKKTEGDLRT